jgi:hypothetical protein
VSSFRDRQEPQHKDNKTVFELEEELSNVQVIVMAERMNMAQDLKIYQAEVAPKIVCMNLKLLPTVRTFTPDMSMRRQSIMKL